MTYATLCSGIGAPELAFSGFGWKQAFCSEIEPFPCAVLKHHFPDVPNYGDITKFKDWSGDHSIDLLIGGTPCQSFSIAGLRKGMADPRGNLALTFLAIARRYTPAWVVWENVPGVLSIDNGRAFGSFLGGLAKLGYGFAYRVLDAQFYGVAQRRRRVFVVGHIGGQWQRAAAVLFERESLFGNTSPSREKREGITPTISARTKSGGGLGTDFDCDGGLIADTSHSPLVATALQHRDAKGADSNTKPGHLIVSSIAPTMRAGGNRTGGDRPPGTDVDTCETLVAFSCKDHGADAGDITPTLRACGHNESHANSGAPPAIAFQPRIARNGRGDMGDKVNALNAQSGQTGKGDAAPCVAFQTLPRKGLGVRVNRYGSAQERDAVEVLQILRIEIGEEAFTEWMLGISDSFQSTEVLQPGLHGPSLRREANETGCGVDDGALAREKNDFAMPLSEVRAAGRERRASQGWRLSEQYAKQLNSALSWLSHQGASTCKILLSLRKESQGAGAMQPSLHSVQGGKDYAVRRLTPTECERLMGFPDDFTAIQYRGKPACDGPRYKALGNSMAVPVIKWVGDRIRQLEGLP